MRDRKLVLISGIIIFIFSSVASSWALGFGIDKPKIRLSIAPGAYDSGEIKVENRGKQPLSIKVYLEDWVYNQQGGSKEFMPKGTHALSCSNWITFYPADFTLAGGASQVVRYTVNVPSEAQGGHYSVMFFETGSGEIEKVNPQGETVTVKVLNRVGSLFYVEAQGTIAKTAEIKNLNIQQKLNDLSVMADFINTGNADINARGTLSVLDNEGLVYARAEFDEIYTLPQDKATLRATAQSVNLKAGSYVLLITLEFVGGGSLVQEYQFDFSANGSITSITPKN